MIRAGRVAALAVVLTVGTHTANAESSISADGIKATSSELTVATVNAEKPGYIVVHTTDFTGTLPGAVIGHAPVAAGENTNVSVTFERQAARGATLIVMLHEERTGDTVFDAGDKPATTGLGPVRRSVTVE